MSVEEWKATVDTVVKHFGSHVLGLVMFLVLWVWVVAPQMERQRLDFEALGKIVGDLNATQLQLRQNQDLQLELSRTIESTALIVDRLVTRLENAK